MPRRQSGIADTDGELGDRLRKPHPSRYCLSMMRQCEMVWLVMVGRTLQGQTLGVLRWEVNEGSTLKQRGNAAKAPPSRQSSEHSKSQLHVLSTIRPPACYFCSGGLP